MFLNINIDSIIHVYALYQPRMEHLHVASTRADLTTCQTPTLGRRAGMQAGGPHLVHIVLVKQCVVEGVEGVEEVHDRRWGHLFTHLGEATDVREQDRDLQAVAGSSMN